MEKNGTVSRVSSLTVLALPRGLPDYSQVDNPQVDYSQVDSSQVDNSQVDYSQFDMCTVQICQLWAGGGCRMKSNGIVALMCGGYVVDTLSRPSLLDSKPC